MISLPSGFINLELVWSQTRMEIECPFCRTVSTIEGHFPCESGPEINTHYIDRISNAGNAITPSNLNLGPLMQSAVGNKVRGVAVDLSLTHKLRRCRDR